MNQIGFDWDMPKAKSNFKKHKVSFEEAVSVFFDEFARDYYDPDNSEKEDRFIMLGLSRKLRVLVVSYTHRKKESVIRIISARKGTKNETRNYFRR